MTPVHVMYSERDPDFFKVLNSEIINFKALLLYYFAAGCSCNKNIQDFMASTVQL